MTNSVLPPGTYVVIVPDPALDQTQRLRTQVEAQLQKQPTSPALAPMTDPSFFRGSTYSPVTPPGTTPASSTNPASISLPPEILNQILASIGLPPAAQSSNLNTAFANVQPADTVYAHTDPSVQKSWEASGYGFSQQAKDSAKVPLGEISKALDDLKSGKLKSGDLPGILEKIATSIMSDKQITQDEYKKFKELFVACNPYMTQVDRQSAIGKLGQIFEAGRLQAGSNLLADLVQESNPEVVSNLTGGNRLQAAAQFANGFNSNQITQLINTKGNPDNKIATSDVANIVSNLENMAPNATKEEKRDMFVSAMQQLIKNTGLSEGDFWDKVYKGTITDVAGPGALDLIRRLTNFGLGKDLNESASAQEIAEAARAGFQGVDARGGGNNDGVGWGDSMGQPLADVSSANGNQAKERTIRTNQAMSMAGYDPTKEADRKAFFDDVRKGRMRNGADPNAILHLLKRIMTNDGNHADGQLSTYDNGNPTRAQRNYILDELIKASNAITAK